MRRGIFLIPFLAFLFSPLSASAETCTCTGTATLTAVGQGIAAAISYSTADFASDCESYGFNATDWTCSGSITENTEHLNIDADCEDIDADYIMNYLGLSDYSPAVSASLDCSTSTSAAESSSSTTGSSGTSTLCSGTTCTQDKVGIFMKDISAGCGNYGDCTLDDILLVFVNVGNFVLGIIGGVVLLMYVIGGFYWVASFGKSEMVSKGQKYMIISTWGLLFVMFSYLGVYAIKGALILGTFQVEGDYLTCTGSADTEGKPCNLHSTCKGGLCLSQCEQNNENNVTTSGNIVSYYQCVDRSSSGGWATSNTSTDAIWYTPTTCQTNLCPGDANRQCCQVSRETISEY